MQQMKISAPTPYRHDPPVDHDPIQYGRPCRRPAGHKVLRGRRIALQCRRHKGGDDPAQERPATRSRAGSRPRSCSDAPTSSPGRTAYCRRGTPAGQQLGADPLLVALDLAKARNELGKHEENIQDIIPIQFPAAQQPDLWVELGIASLGKDDPDGARIAFEEAFDTDSTRASGRIGRIGAHSAIRNNEFGEAEKLADEILITEPQNAEAWFVKGSASHAQGKFKDAIAAYGKAQNWIHSTAGCVR